MNTKQQKSIDPYLNRIEIKMKSGDDQFASHYSNPNIKLSSFWKWSSSDLLTNTTRGILAEFLVASALDIVKSPRIEWESHDLIFKSDVKIEVKSAAKYQTWNQKKASPIKFTIAKRYEWNGDTGEYSSERFRSADIYVFCELNGICPMNIDNWDFYVLLTERINEKCGDQKTITLQSLQNLFPETKKKYSFGELCRIIEVQRVMYFADGKKVNSKLK